MFLIIPPPSQPSPKGEGAKNPFPLGGNKKGGINIKEMIIYYHNSEVLHSYRDSLFVQLNLFASFVIAFLDLLFLHFASLISRE